MRKTPWASSSLPSDRIKPSYSTSNNDKSKRKNAAATEPPKSKETRQLESLISALRLSVAQKDPQGGCFCQAREHQLSPYCPICRTCGLVLCLLNQPHFLCPHCSSAILTETQRDALVERIESQISDVLTKEAAERQRILDEARREAGAFPALSKSSASNMTFPSNKSSRNTTPSPQPATHKVMSLPKHGKKGPVVVSSYTPVPSRPESRAESELEAADEGPVRVPPPASQVSSSKKRPDAARPWLNLGSGGAKYIPNKPAGNGEPRSKRNRKGKARETQAKENQTIVGSSSEI